MGFCPHTNPVSKIPGQEDRYGVVACTPYGLRTVALGSFQVLRYRDYALIWGSGAVSDVGTWMQTVALAALVTDLTQSATWGAIVGATTFLTGGIVTPLGGVMADRYERRRLLLVTSMLLAGVACAVAFAQMQQWLSPALVTLAVAVEGVLVAVALPTRGAMLPDLVPAERLVDAAALGSASWNLGRIVGPALAGVAIAANAVSWIFLANAASFLGIALAMLLLRYRSPVSADESHTQAGSPSVWRRLGEGVEGARAEPGCRTALVMLGVTAFLVSPFIALVPAMAQIALQGEPVDTAHLVMAQGVGSVAGALTLGGLGRRFGLNRLLRMTFLALPAAEIAYASVPSKVGAIAGLVVLGVLYAWMLTGVSTVVQLRAPTAVRARLLSLLFMVLGIIYPLGAALQGVLADTVGVRRVLVAGAAVHLVLMLFAARRRPDSLATMAPLPAHSAGHRVEGSGHG